jgi:hypothetical protein
MEAIPNPTSRRPGNPAFVPGNQVNPAGRPTKAERAAQVRKLMIKLARPLGGLRSLNSLDLERLRLAAELAQRQPKNAEDRVRVANAIDRMLGSVERSRLGAKPQRRQSTVTWRRPSSRGASPLW